MSDDPNALAPIPTSYAIPEADIVAWTALPLEHPIDLRLTKAEVDYLFFALDRLAHSLDETQVAVRKAMAGDVAGANTNLQLGLARAVDSQNSARHFLHSVIISTLRGQKR